MTVKEFFIVKEFCNWLAGNVLLIERWSSKKVHSESCQNMSTFWPLEAVAPGQLNRKRQKLRFSFAKGSCSSKRGLILSQFDFRPKLVNFSKGSSFPFKIEVLFSFFQKEAQKSFPRGKLRKILLLVPFVKGNQGLYSLTSFPS